MKSVLHRTIQHTSVLGRAVADLVIAVVLIIKLDNSKLEHF